MVSFSISHSWTMHHQWIWWTWQNSIRRTKSVFNIGCVENQEQQKIKWKKKYQINLHVGSHVPSSCLEWLVLSQSSWRICMVCDRIYIILYVWQPKPYSELLLLLFLSHSMHWMRNQCECWAFIELFKIKFGWVNCGVLYMTNLDGFTSAKQFVQSFTLSICNMKYFSIKFSGKSKSKLQIFLIDSV